MTVITKSSRIKVIGLVLITIISSIAKYKYNCNDDTETNNDEISYATHCHK